MKKIVLFCGFCLSLFCVHSQVLLKTQLPAAGLVVKSQLWNLTIINASSQSMNVRIEMLLTRVSNNQKIITGVTKTFLLPRGAFQLNPVNATPVSYNVLSSDYNLNINQDGFLPIGVFNVCYTVMGFSHNTETPLAEECETVEVEPISPPMLVSPGDHELVEVARPLFNWLPPNPVALFNNLSYDFTLVEVQKTQTASVAIQQNLPLHSQQNISLTNLQYPQSLPELDTTKTYAWQVVARSGHNPIAESEIWVFKLKSDNSKTVRLPVADYYSKLKKDVDASYAICNGILKFAYSNETNDKAVFIKIFDITNARQREVSLDSSILTVEYGENFKQLDLSEGSSFKDKHVYMLDLKNSNEQHWFLKFEYRKSTPKL